MQVLFHRLSLIDVTIVRVSNKDLKTKTLQILWKNSMIGDSSEYNALFF